MSGVITGSGLGLFGSSANVLGNGGMLGGSLQGRVGAGVRAYVNAANGNLILQSPDEMLSGRGADLGLLRTYNLQGTITSSSNGLGWSWEGGDNNVYLKSGTVNTAGSIVTRVTGDGHETDYTFSGGKYVSTAGGGAHDTLSHSGTTWTWTDGSTRQTEVYGESLSSSTHGRLQSRTDASGNSLTFTYAGGMLTGISDTKSGQHIELVYTSGRLTQVNTYELNVDSNGKVIQPPVVSTTAIKQVSYTYDSSGRLSTVTSYLKPGDASSPVFVTAYTYDGTSNRIASVLQNDGSSTTAGTKVEFTYEQIPNSSQFRVKTVTDANGLQTFKYNTDGTTDITISAADGGTNAQTWTYTYDGQQQLAVVQAPSVNGARPTTRNFYDNQGNLIKVVDARGNATIYQYDTNGNLLIQRDSLGNTVKRTYDANNQLLTETRYVTPDAGIDDNTIGIGSASGALTAHYVYDTSARLRFAISAEGRVTEYRYTSDGLLERTIQYAGGRFDVSTLAADTSPSEGQMTAWIGQSTLDKTKIELTQYLYDFRGNLIKRTDFASADSSGAGVAIDSGNVVTEYVYDGHGSLIHSVVRHGAVFDQGTQTTYVYDGLGREISRTDAAGTTATTAYNDLTGAITVDTDSAANAHLRTISAYDTRGRLISVSQADASASSSARLTGYLYDDQGRLALTLDPQGGRRFSFYDAAGRLSFIVDATGAVTGFTYNENGQTLTETHYDNRLAGIDATHDANSMTNAWLDSASSPAKVTKQTLVLGTDLIVSAARDRTIAYHYDAAGRLDTRTDAVGTQTVMQYDGASRVTQQTTGDRVTRSYYDHDSRLVGVLDPLGFLTEYKYNAAGHLVETVRYNTRSPLAAERTRPIWIGADQSNAITQNAAGGKPFLYRIPAFDADGDPLTFSVVSKPAWMTVTNDAGGVTLSGTPPTATTLTTHTVVLRANDGRGTSLSTADVTVSIKVNNSAPLWGPIPDFTFTNKTAGTFLLPVASDAESAASTLKYSFTGLPAGIAFNGSATAPALTGTPTTPGVYTVVGTVKDAQNKATTCTFVIQVADAGAPIVPPVPQQFATRTQAFSLNIGVLPVTDPDGQALTYTIFEKPDWLTLTGDSTSITFGGTPPATTSVGTYWVRFEVSDPQFGAQIVSFPVSVSNAAPIWDSVLPPMRTRATFDYTPPKPTDPDGPADGHNITYSAEVFPFRPIDSVGLSIDPVTGRITGTMANAVEGRTYGVDIYAHDNDPDDPRVTHTVVLFTIDRTPTFNTGRPLNIGTESGTDLFYELPTDMFLDGDGDPLTVTATGMPPGVGFVAGDGISSLGHFVGTSTSPGFYTVTVTAADALGASVSMTGMITIAARPPSPPRPPPPPPPGPHNPIDPRPPISPFFRASSGGDGDAAAAVPPIESPPPPVLIEAPVVHAAALPPPPAPITTIVPVEDVLASARPAASDKDLHSFRFYDGVGRTTVAVDERGFVAESVYDEQLNQQRTLRYVNPVTATSATALTKIRSDAGAVVESTTVQFDNAGRVTSTTVQAGATLATVSVTNLQYDSRGRVTREVVAAGTSDERSTRTVYDVFGDVIGMLGGEADAALLTAHPTPTAADISAAVTANGVTYAYDTLGRRTKATDGLGHVTLYYYDSEGRPAYTVNALGELSELIYNAYGELTTQRRYAKRLSSSQLTTLKSAGGGAVTSTLTGMLSALRSTSTDQTTTFDYDQRGLLTTRTDAADNTSLGIVTTDAYDQYGQLLTQTRAISSTASVTTRFDRDLDGRLVSTTGDVNGINFNTQTRYDAYGRVTQTLDGAGRITSRIDYKDSGRTIEVRDALSLDASGNEVAGHMVHTEYDFASRITKITDATGKTTSYSYDDANRSMTVTTPEGVAITTVKTREGETLSVTHGSNVTTYGYNKNGQLLTVTDALGHTVASNTYDLKSGLETRSTDARGVVTKFSYDVVNRLVERRVDPKNLNGTNDNPNGLDLVCTYAFDAFGQQTTVTEGHGTNTSANITKVTQYKYDQDGRNTQIIVDPSGLKLATTFTYDRLGNTTQVSRGSTSTPNQQVIQYVFDKLGRRVKEIEAPSGIFGTGSASGRNLTTEYRYDLAGNMTRKIDALGNSTWFVYDKAGRLTQTINALGEVSERTLDANGRVTQTRGYLTRLAASTVAGFGDAVGTQTPGVNVNDSRMYFVYDDDGRTRYVLQAAGLAADGNTMQWTIGEQRYDLNGNVSEKRVYDKFLSEARVNAIDTASSPGITVAEMVTELQTLGYTTAESTLTAIERTRFVYDAANRLRFTVDALGDVSESTYDDAGNVLMSERYATRPTLTAFDLTTVNNAVDRNNVNNQVTRFSYDAAARLRFTVRVLTSDGHGVATQQAVSELRYDDLGRVIERRAYARMLGTVSDYLAATLATKVADTTFVNVSDRRSIIAYDAAGRQVFSLQASKNNTSGQATNYIASKRVYDDVGHVTQSIAYANEITATLADDKAATIAGAIVASDQDRLTQFIYDQAGRQHFVIAADNTYSENVFDALGRLVERRQFDIVLTSRVPRTEAALIARRAGRHVGDGITHGERYVYDAASRLLQTFDAAGKSETSVYDAAGNRTSLTDRNGGVWTYNYDRMGRAKDAITPAVAIQLSTESGPTNRALDTRYTYDSFGNLTTTIEAFGTADARTTTYGYDKLNRQTTVTRPAVLVQLSGETSPSSRALQTLLEYDAVGNLRSTTDAFGTTDARKTAFDYDALGRRTTVTLPGLYDPAHGKVIAPPAAGQTAPSGTFARTVETTYDAFDGAVRTKTRTGAGTNDFQYAFTTFDVAGRVAQEVDALNYVTAYTYTAFGERQTTTRYSVKVTGNPSNGAPASGGYWTIADIAAQAQFTNDALSRTVTTLYDTVGRKTDVTQAVVGAVYATFDNTINRNVGSSALVNAAATTHYDYDEFGELSHEALRIDTLGTDSNFRAGHWRDTFHYYNALGQETLTIDPRGYQTARTFDANGNLKQITEYAGADRIPALADSATPPPPTLPSSFDRTTVYNYDALNQQTSIQRLGLTYSVLVSPGTYVEQHGDVTVATMTYDSAGHVRKRTDAANNVTTTDYNLLGQVIKVTEPARVTARTANANTDVDPFLAANQVLASPTTSFTFNAFGQTVKQVRAPNGGYGATLTTTQAYDFAGNLISTVANGHERKRQVDYAGRVIVETQVLNLDYRIDPTSVAGVSQTLERRYAYDLLGRQTNIADVYQQVHWNTDGTASFTPKQSGQRQQFDAFGDVTATRRIFGDPATAVAALADGPLVATYAYDNAGHLTTKQAADGLTYYYYDLAGNLTRQEQRGDLGAGNANIAVTVTGYDEVGHAVQQRLPQFGGTTPFIGQGFDRWGNLRGRTVGGYLAYDNGPSADPVYHDGFTTTYDYDADNRVVAVHQEQALAYRNDGSGYSVKVTHATKYDILGRAVQTQELVDDATTWPDVEAVNMRTRSREYNAVGQLMAETDATGHRTEYEYDANGFRVGMRNAHGTVFVDRFDSDGNVLTHNVLRVAIGGGADDLEYQSFGTANSATVTARLINQYQYDEADRRVASGVDIDRFGTIVGWTYTQYDERNLAVAERQPAGRADGTTLGVTARMEYDVLGNKTLQLDANQLKANASAPGIQHGQQFTYKMGDYVVGQLDSTTVTTIAGAANVTSYLYDGFGRLAQETRPGSNNFRKYTYFENGWLKTIEDHITQGVQGGMDADYWAVVDTTNYNYDARGLRTDESFTRTGQKEVEVGQWVDVPQGEGASLPVWTVTGTQIVNLTPSESPQRQSTTTYDLLGRIVTVVASGNSRPSLNMKFYYDELSNRRAVIASSQGIEQWYSYDAEGRMTLVDGQSAGVAGSTGTVVTYDELGRRQTAEYSQGHKVGFHLFDDPWLEWDQTRTERYSYNDLGYLTLVEQAVHERNITNFAVNPTDGSVSHAPAQPGSIDIGFIHSAEYMVDQRGARWNSKIYKDLDPVNFITTATLLSTSGIVVRDDGLVSNSVTTVTGFSRNSSLTNVYDDAGVLTSYVYLPEAHGNGASNDQLKITYTYTYDTEFGGYKVESILAHTERMPGSNASVPGDAFTENKYDPRGMLLQQTIRDSSATRIRTFSYDNDGHIVTKSEEVHPKSGSIKSGTQDYYYSSGNEIAVLGTGTFAGSHFDSGFVPISSAYPAATPSTYAVNNGDTLAGIARAMWGDASLWYLIADANSVSFGPNDALTGEVGKTYRIPNVVTGVHNDATTFAPYNEANIFGNSTPSPTLAPPSCGDKVNHVIAAAVIIAVAAAVTYFTAGALAGTAGPVAAEAITSETIAYGAIGAASGNLAGQLAGWGLGVNSGVSGKQVLGATLTSVLANTAQVAEAAEFGEQFFASSAGAVLSSAQSSLAGVLGNAAVGGNVSVAGAFTSFALNTIVGAAFGDIGNDGVPSSSPQPWYHKLLESEISGVANGAVNPDSGYLTRTHDWSTLVSSALDPFAEWAGGQLGQAALSRLYPPPQQSLSARPPDYMPGSAQARAVSDQLDQLDLAQQFADDEEAIANEPRGPMYAQAGKRRSIVYQSSLFGGVNLPLGPVDDRSPEPGPDLTGATEDPAVQASVADTADPTLLTSSMSEEDALNQENDAKLDSAETRKQNELSEAKLKAYLAAQAAAAAEAKAAAEANAAAEAEAAAAAQEKQRAIRENRDSIMNLQARLLHHGVTQNEIDSTLGESGTNLLKDYGYDPSFLRRHHAWGFDSLQDNLIQAIVNFSTASDTHQTISAVTPHDDAIRAQDENLQRIAAEGAKVLTPGGFLAGTAGAAGRAVGQYAFRMDGESVSDAYWNTAVQWGPVVDGVAAPFARAPGSSVPTPVDIPHSGIEYGTIEDPLVGPGSGMRRIQMELHQLPVSEEPTVIAEGVPITVKEPTVYVRFQGQTFATLDAARIDAVQFSNPHSVSEGIEFSGRFFQAPDGTIGYSGPTTLDQANTSNPFDAPIHPEWGVEIPEDYHTHGNMLSAVGIYDHLNPTLAPVEGEPNVYKWEFPGRDAFHPNQFSFADVIGGRELAGRYGGSYNRTVGTPSGRILQMEITPTGETIYVLHSPEGFPGK